jgi:hypothetical protein
VTNIRLLWKCPFRLQRYSFITTLFLGPFDDVITKFYCICRQKYDTRLVSDALSFYGSRDN